MPPSRCRSGQCDTRLARGTSISSSCCSTETRLSPGHETEGRRCHLLAILFVVVLAVLVIVGVQHCRQTEGSRYARPDPIYAQGSPSSSCSCCCVLEYELSYSRVPSCGWVALRPPPSLLSVLAHPYSYRYPPCDPCFLASPAAAAYSRVVQYLSGAGSVLSTPLPCLLTDNTETER